MEPSRVSRLALCAALVLVLASPVGLAAQEGARMRVLVVMSYDETYPFEAEMREGIEAGLASSCELRYFYMNTKKDFAGGPAKAAEAYALFLECRPDGVIAADDDAQAMFVVPYLRDKVATPVMFCGVNAEPGKYGFPASNVSGILERGHVPESIALACQLVPGLRRASRIVKDTPMSRDDELEFRGDVEAAGLAWVPAPLPSTIGEALEIAASLRASCDLVLVSTLQGVAGEDGEPLSNRAAISRVTKAFGKATIGSTLSDVQDGALCAVIQSGQEQGRTAADMLLRALGGESVSSIEMTKNKFGRRIINVDVMRGLGIDPKPIVVRNAELVSTED